MIRTRRCVRSHCSTSRRDASLVFASVFRLLLFALDRAGVTSSASSSDPRLCFFDFFLCRFVSRSLLASRGAASSSRTLRRSRSLFSLYSSLLPLSENKVSHQKLQFWWTVDRTCSQLTEVLGVRLELGLVHETQCVLTEVCGLTGQCQSDHCSVVVRVDTLHLQYMCKVVS